MAGTLRIQLLGRFHAEADGVVVERFASRRTRDLLAYLALFYDTAQARERLAELLWSDSDVDHARRSLNTTVWRLQSALKQAGQSAHLHVSAQQMILRTARCVVDVAEFEQNLALASQTSSHINRIRLYARAVEAYSGELLPDCYDDWAVEARERLELQYLHALEILVADYTHTNQHALAANAAARILVRDPLREDIHRQLIALYLANDEPARALKQYRACARALDVELGARPSHETQLLLPRVLAALPTRDVGVSVSSTLRPVEDDLATITACVERLVAWCDQARAQLLEVTELLERLPSRLEPQTREGGNASRLTAAANASGSAGGLYLA